MFTGIVEETGIIVSLLEKRGCLLITVSASFAGELKNGQSVAHNGVCLTVIKANAKTYTCKAVKETLSRTNLGKLKKGDRINLERSLLLSDRLDGHIVQGHVDQTVICTSIIARKGEWDLFFKYKPSEGSIVVTKGSVCINGVSLTVVKVKEAEFSVAVIPHTYRVTNLSDIKRGDTVNIEFDIIGKYISRLVASF